MQRTDEALVRIAGATTIVNAANGLSLNGAMSGSYLSSVPKFSRAQLIFLGRMVPGSDHSKTRTPVHKQRLTSDESGIVAGKKDNRRRDLLRTGKSSHWHFG
jgi:hypothetical protein